MQEPHAKSPQARPMHTSPECPELLVTAISLPQTATRHPTPVSSAHTTLSALDLQFLAAITIVDLKDGTANTGTELEI